MTSKPSRSPDKWGELSGAEADDTLFDRLERAALVPDSPFAPDSLATAPFIDEEAAVRLSGSNEPIKFRPCLDDV